jgi:hypothetical protein
MTLRHSRSASALLLFPLCFALLAFHPAIASAWNPQAAATDVAQAQRISEFVAAQDWLGPISAIALSPFFGLACLSGIATYGPEWLRNSPLLSVSGPFNSPFLFWCMAALTLVTSLPRWTKFSKPIAMALEKIEAYSAIIILLAVRFSANPSDASGGADVAAIAPVFAEAGILSLPVEILLSLALAINLIVVNTVKLVVDLLVWLTPIPAIDLILEVTGKVATASLLGLYAFSPFLATLINLGIFVVCSLIFFASKRALVYFREVYVRPTIERVIGLSPSSCSLQSVFLDKKWNGYPRRTRGQLIPNPDGKTSKLVVSRWFSTRQFEVGTPAAKATLGLVADTLAYDTDHGPLTLEARKGIFTPLERAASVLQPQET